MEFRFIGSCAVALALAGCAGPTLTPAPRTNLVPGPTEGARS
jgi:hypothetical protein